MSLSVEFIEILERVREFVEKAPTHIVWFRGHAHSHYELNSQIFRAPRAAQNIPEVLGLEKELYLNFQRNVYPHIGLVSGFDALFHMQHHGAPTRLLDWSQSFSVALYFATEEWMNNRQSSPHVWALSPYVLNYCASKFGKLIVPDNDAYDRCLNGELQYKHTFAIAPRLMNPRLVAQQGCFTVQGNAGVALDQEKFPHSPGNGILGEGTLQRIDIPESIWEEVRWLIGPVSGHARRTLFPDVDGVSADIRLMYQSLHPILFT